MEFTFKTQLHYLIHVVDGEYVAHCLDADLVGTGKTKKEAIAELNLAVRALAAYAISTHVFQIMSLCKPAPEWYWQKFEEAKQISGVKEHKLDVCPQFPPVKVQHGEARRPQSIQPIETRVFTYCVAELKVAA